MRFKDLPREKQEALMILSHRREIEVENDKRRQCTRFGYRFGGLAGLCAAVGGMVVLTGILLIVLALVAPSLNTTPATSPLFWGCFAPMTLVPILPFVFMKPRYTLWPVTFIVVVFVVVGLLTALGTWIMDSVVQSLT